MSENQEFPVYKPFRSVKDSDYLFEQPPEVPKEVKALNDPQPLKFYPILSKRPWGGKRLSQVLGKKIPASETIGESWEISGYPDAESIVNDGDLKGFRFNDIMRIWQYRLLGNSVKPSPDNTFPLLAKFIDSNENLSVQVHPGDILNEHGNVVRWGKTEAWYIIDAAPDAFIYQGFNRDVTADEVKIHIENETIEEILLKVSVKKGDVIVNPATVVHSIGAGVLLYEIQQVSDATYRMYDFGREGRELHLKEALRVAYKKQGLPEVQKPRQHLSAAVTRLAETDYFMMYEVDVIRDKIVSLADIPRDKAYLFHCISGNVELQAGEFLTKLSIGESVLIPACLTPLKSVTGAGKLLLSTTR